MDNIPIDRSKLIEVIFNAVEKGKLTEEYELTAIAEIIALLYSKIENLEEELVKAKASLNMADKAVDAQQSLLKRAETIINKQEELLNIKKVENDNRIL